MTNKIVVRTRVLLLASLCVASAGCDIFTSTEARLARGERLLAAGSYAEAIVELKNALDAEPKNARGLLGVTRASLQLGRLDAAEKALADARAAGAPAREVDALHAELRLGRGEYDQLRAELDGDTLKLSDDARADYRLRLASASGDCTTVLTAARALLAADAKRPGARVALAECLARRGSFTAARTELETAVASDEHDAAAWFALGRLRQSHGDRRGAEAAYHSAASNAAGRLSVPQQSMLYSALAQLQTERGDLAGLRETRAAVLAVAPGSIVSELLGANLDLLDGKVEPAVATLQRLLSSEEKFGPARLLLTSALLAQNNIEQARQQLGTLVRDLPNLPALKTAEQELGKIDAAKSATVEYWLQVGLVHAGLDQPAMTRAAFERALKIDPKSQAASIGLVQLELRIGDTAAALARATELAKSAPDDSGVALLLANTQSENGDHAASAATLEKLHLKSPKNSLAMAIHLERKRGALGDENAVLERWLADHPDDRKIRFGLAESLRVAGDNRRAAAEFETLIEREPRDVGSLNNLAWVYYLLKDKRALGTAKRAYELAPKVASVADTYGWLLVESGALREGLELLRETDAAAGGAQPEIRYHYAAALLRSGQKDQARVLLDDLLINSPEFDSREDAAALLRSLSASAATWTGFTCWEIDVQNPIRELRCIARMRPSNA